MRISTDSTDPAFIDARPRKVWLNESEVQGWITADEFRRCVTTAAGAMYGAVRIERLPESYYVRAPAYDGEHEGFDGWVQMPANVLYLAHKGVDPNVKVEPPPECSTSLAGMFVPVAAPVEATVDTPAPTFAVPTVAVIAKPVAKPVAKRKGKK